MQTPRILITRPEPGATRTAARLRAAGFEPVILPLTRINRLEYVLPDKPVDGVVVTSARALSGVDTAVFNSLPIVAVGETTANAAREAGFLKIDTASGSAESVAALAASAFRPGSHILYFCGKVRRPELEALLDRSGFTVVAIETYNAEPIDHKTKELSEILGNEPFDIVILMSAVTAELFSHHALNPQFRDALSVCFSQRIADVASFFGCRTAVTDEPTEDSLVKFLTAHFSI
jgi:uroporphyrinogen-III synthase